MLEPNIENKIESTPTQETNEVYVGELLTDETPKEEVAEETSEVVEEEPANTATKALRLARMTNWANEVSSEKKYSVESFYKDVISDPEKRYAFYQDFMDVYDVPDFITFSKQVLKDGKDIGAPEDDRRVSAYQDGIRRIKADGTVMEADYRVEGMSPLDIKLSHDPTYQSLLVTEPKKAEEYKQYLELSSPDEAFRASYLGQEMEKMREFVAEGGDSYTYFANKSDEVAMFLNAKAQDKTWVQEVGDFFRDEEDVYQDDIGTRQLYEYSRGVGKNRNILLKDPTNQTAQKELKEYQKLYDEKMYDIYAKGTEDASELKRISSSISDGGDLNLNDISSLFKIAYGNEEAAKLIEPYYNKAAALGNINYSLPLSDEEKRDLQIISNEAKTKLARRNARAIDFSKPDFNRAVEAAPPYPSGIEYDEDYLNMSDRDKFMMTYLRKFDYYKELLKHKKDPLQEVVSELNAVDDEYLTKERMETFDYLKEYSDLYLLNASDFNADASGFWDGVGKFAENLPSQLEESIVNVISDVNPIATDAEAVKKFARENPQEAAKSTGNLGESVEYFYEKKDDKLEDRKRSILTDYDQLGEITANTAVMAAELYGGQGAVKGLQKLTGLGSTLSKFANMPYDDLAQALRIGSRTGRYAKGYGLVGKALSKSPRLTYHLMQGGKSGLNYQAAGILFNETDELHFGAGIFGYGGSWLGSKVGAKVMKQLDDYVPRMASFFGADSGKIANAIKDFGLKQSKRAGVGFGEVGEEELQNITNAVLNSASFESAIGELKKLYGDFGDVGNRMLASWFMGSLLSGTALGEAYIDQATKQRAKIKESIVDIKKDKYNNAAKIKEAENALKAIEAEEKNAQRVFDDLALKAGINENIVQGAVDAKKAIPTEKVAKKTVDKEIEKKEGEKFDEETVRLAEQNDKVVLEKLEALRGKAENSLELSNTLQDKLVSDIEAVKETNKEIERGENLSPNESVEITSEKIRNKSNLSRYTSSVIDKFSSGEPLSAAIESTAKEEGVNPNELKRLIVDGLDSETETTLSTEKAFDLSNRETGVKEVNIESSPELELLKDDVEYNKEQGTITENLDTEVVFTNKEGKDIVGTLTESVNGNIIFQPKGKKKGQVLGSKSEIENDYISDYGYYNTDSEGNRVSDREAVTRERNSMVSNMFPKETKAFQEFNKKVEKEKSKLDEGKIDQVKYDENISKHKAELEKTVPDIAGSITEQSQLDDFNDALVSERNMNMDTFFKDRLKKRKGVIAKAKEVAKEGRRQTKAKLADRIKEFKEKQKELDAKKQAAEVDLINKRKQLKAAQDKYNNAYGKPKQVLKKEDGTTMTTEEILAKLDESIESGDLSGIIESISGLSKGDLSVRKVREIFNKTSNDLQAQTILAGSLTDFFFDQPTIIDTAERYQTDYKAAEGSLPIIVNANKGLRWIANKIGVGAFNYRGDASKNILEFVSIGGLMNVMHPDLAAKLEYYKDDLISRERVANHQVKELQRLIDKYKKDNKIKDESIEEAVDQALRGIPQDNIPDSIQQQIRDMQVDLDRFGGLLAELGLIDEGSFIQRQADGSYYMTTTYKRDYKDGKWSEQFEKALEEGKFDDARELIRKQNQEIDADGFNGKSLEEQSQQIDDELRGIAMSPRNIMDINVKTDNMGASVKNLKKKKDIDVAIQEVMGVEKSPYINYMNSIRNQASLLEGYSRQKAIVEYGLENGLIEEVGKSKSTKEENTKQGKASREGWIKPTKNPPSLFNEDGKVYRYKQDFYDVLMAHNSAVDGKSSMAGVIYRKLNSTIKQLNTVFSPASHVSNIMGAMSTTVSNGHINPAYGMEALKTALHGTPLGDFIGKTIVGDYINIKEVDPVLKKAFVQYGVMDAGMSSEIAKVIKNAMKGLTKDQKSVLGKTLEKDGFQGFLGAILSFTDASRDTAVKIYQAVDNLARANGFIHELMFEANMNNSFYELNKSNNKTAIENLKDFIKTDEGRAAMAKAKASVDATYPTYSKVPRGLKWVSENTPLGTFVSFPAEAIRTSANMWTLGAGEVRQSYTDPNLNDRQKSLLRMKGIKRVTFASSVQLLFWGIAAGSAKAIFESDEEEEAVRNLMPEWYKNSNLLYYMEDGEIRFIDFDRYNSYGLPLGIARALMKGEFGEAVNEAYKPFFDINMTSKALIEAWQGKTFRGKDIYTDRDTSWEKLGSGISHVALGSSGSVSKFIQKIIKQQYGKGIDYEGNRILDTDYNGDEIDLGDEFLGLIGVRSNKLKPNPKRALSSERRDYVENRKLLNAIKKKDMDASYLSKVNRIHSDIVKDMRKKWEGVTVLVSRNKTDMSTDELISLMSKSAGMSKDDFIEQVVNGVDKEIRIADGESYYADKVDE